MASVKKRATKTPRHTVKSKTAKASIQKTKAQATKKSTAKKAASARTASKKAAAKKTSALEAFTLNAASISSKERLDEMLKEVNQELNALQPAIDKLEVHLKKLQELRLAKQKLITLKLSIQSILDNFSLPPAGQMSLLDGDTEALKPRVRYIPTRDRDLDQLFLPEKAFEEAAQILKQKDSLNFELFRAIVFHGGQASTEEIRQYLVDNDVKQPASGEGFEKNPLTEISARVNYLVRKKLVATKGRGQFRSLVGWQSEL